MSGVREIREIELPLPRCLQDFLASVQLGTYVGYFKSSQVVRCIQHIQCSTYSQLLRLRSDAAAGLLLASFCNAHSQTRSAKSSSAGRIAGGKGLFMSLRRWWQLRGLNHEPTTAQQRTLRTQSAARGTWVGAVNEVELERGKRPRPMFSCNVAMFTGRRAHLDPSRRGAPQGAPPSRPAQRRRDASGRPGPAPWGNFRFFGPQRRARRFEGTTADRSGWSN